MCSSQETSLSSNGVDHGPRSPPRLGADASHSKPWPSVNAVLGYAAIMLAGGAGRRLGGSAKPSLPVGGVPMLDRVLAAVEGAAPRVVVGPPALAAELPPAVLLTSEQPPGGGPVAAIAAGLRLLPRDAGQVALLAADLPFLTAEAVATLRAALATADPAESTVDGVVFVDEDGRHQLLCGVWRVPAVRSALDALGDPAGQSVRRLVAGLRLAECRWSAPGPRPWYDCDTESALETARQTAREWGA